MDYEASDTRPNTLVKTAMIKLQQKSWIKQGDA